MSKEYSKYGDYPKEYYDAREFVEGRYRYKCICNTDRDKILLLDEDESIIVNPDLNKLIKNNCKSGDHVEIIVRRIRKNESDLPKDDQLFIT